PSRRGPAAGRRNGPLDALPPATRISAPATGAPVLSTTRPRTFAPRSSVIVTPSRDGVSASRIGGLAAGANSAWYARTRIVSRGKPGGRQRPLASVSKASGRAADESPRRGILSGRTFAPSTGPDGPTTTPAIVAPARSVTARCVS